MTDAARIAEAAERLAGWARETPLLTTPALDALAGRRLLVKAECLQHTGSFKYRGAKAALTAPGIPRGDVVGVSSGNHAQGVARAAAEAGVAATIVMPRDAPAAKLDGVRAYGAELVLYNRFGEDRTAIAAGIVAERGLRLIPPYDDADVIAGQGTVGLEIARQAAAAGITHADVLVCCGGGGLASGIALALADVAPGLRVRTVEPVGFDDMARSLRDGTRRRNAPDARSLCDAILSPTPGDLTFPVLSRLAGPGMTVTDDMALRAMALAFAHLKIVLEPGGAVALAAALFAQDQIEGDAVIAVASGGNADPAIFARALAMGGHPAKATAHGPSRPPAADDAPA